MAEPQRRNLAAGIAFLVLGLVFLVPSGLCTGIFGGGALLDMILYPGNASDGIGLLGMALLFGLPFIVVGILLVRVGVRNLRRK